jgi:hypothetical protein
MRGLKRHRSARTVAAGHAFVQNLLRGHYEIATEQPERTDSVSPSPTSHWPSEPATSPAQAVYPTANATKPVDGLSWETDPRSDKWLAARARGLTHERRGRWLR